MKTPATYRDGTAMPSRAMGSEKLTRKASRLHAMAFDRAMKVLLAREFKTRRGRV